MKNGVFSALLAVLLASSVTMLPIINAQSLSQEEETDEVSRSPVEIIKKDQNKNGDTPNTAAAAKDEIVTFIVRVEGDALLDTVVASGGRYHSVAELLLSADGKKYVDSIKRAQAVVKASIQKMVPDSDFSQSRVYTAVMNGFSVNAPLSSMSKIAKVNGVASVTIAEDDQSVAEPDEPESNDTVPADGTDNAPGIATDSYDAVDILGRKLSRATMSSISGLTADQLSANACYDAGFTGSGILIAVIDNEFDTDHEVFSSVPQNTKYNFSSLETIYNIAGFNTYRGCTASDVYKSGKIIFAYDYSDRDADTREYADDFLWHGTHVAGIAAGNNGKTDDDSFRGVAYDAQLMLLKANNDMEEDGMVGMYYDTDCILAALDDAVKMGADIISMSLGVPRIASDAGLYADICSRISESGIMLISAAGNDSYNALTDDDGYPLPLDARDIDYSTINTRGNGDSSMIVGGSENAFGKSICKVFSLNGREAVTPYKEMIFYDTYENLPFELPDPDAPEYVYVGGIGSEEDYEGKDVSGKVAVVNRGEIDFTEKQQIASRHGAAALIVVNYDDMIPEYMVVSSDVIPVCIVSAAEREYFEENPSGSMAIWEGEYVYTGNKPQSYIYADSSYGVREDLTLFPDIIAPGVDVFSSTPGNNFEYASGTSMATPAFSGSYAIVKQMMQNDPAYNALTPQEKSIFLSSMLMSSAAPVVFPVYDPEESDVLYYTPRIQGAGLPDLEAVMTQKAYLTVNGLMPKVSMRDSMEGKYAFTFTVHNRSDETLHYQLDSVFQTDGFYGAEERYYNSFVPESLSEYTDIVYTVDGESVTEVSLLPQEQKDISVTVELSPEFVLAYMNYFSNGFYVDGYIFLNDAENDAQLSLPVMGFCGDWGGISPFDYTIYSDQESITQAMNCLIAYADNTNGVYSYNYMLAYNGLLDTLSDKLYMGRNILNNTTADELHEAYILPRGQYLRDLHDITISILKGGRSLLDIDAGSWSAVRSGSRDILALDSQQQQKMENLFSSLADGEYEYVISARVMKSNNTLSDPYSVSFAFTEDNKAPVVQNAETFCKDGRLYLRLTAKDDNAMQGFDLYTVTYNAAADRYDYADSLYDLLNEGYVSEDSFALAEYELRDDGTAEFIYDITGLHDQLNALSIRTTTSVDKCSSVKIAYKAADMAWNLSEARIIDAVVYGSASFTFKDQNNIPVEGVGVKFGDETLYSDENGKVRFENLLPDTYYAEIVSLPENYSTDKHIFLTTINTDQYEYDYDLTLQFSGEYPPKPEDISSNSSSEAPAPPTSPDTSKTDEQHSDTSTASSMPSSESHQSTIDNSSSQNSDTSSVSTGDHPVFALVFVSALLSVCVISLAVSKKRRSSDD